MSQPPIKDIWDKISTLSVLLASVLVPLVVAVVGNAYTSVLKESENRLKYTELAIGILREKPSADTQDIRSWAVDIINQYSGVPLTLKARQQLLRSQLSWQDLSNSNFNQSRISDSSFRQVDFTRSDFLKSLFNGSRFDGSIFSDSSFRDARFGRVDLRGADLSDAVIDDKTKLP